MVGQLTLGKMLRARVSFTGLPITDWYGNLVVQCCSRLEMIALISGQLLVKGIH